MNLWTRMLYGSRDQFVDHWSDARAQYYEKQTYRYLGIRPEPVFTWSRKFRPKAKLRIESIAERKRA